MTSQVDVWNLALAMLAQEEEILDPQDRSTKAGRLCNRFWPQVRDEVLQAGAWSCAVRRRALPENGGVAVFQKDGQKRFTLPADCVRPLMVTEDGEKDGRPMPFEREGRILILAAEPPLNIRYVSRDVPVSEWDAELIHAAASLLAKYLAVPFTGKNSERDRMGAEATKALLLAEVREGRNGTQPQLLESGWLAARAGD